MSCNICKSCVSDSRFLWKCESCSKRFHAACIGVKREYEEVVRNHMIPACRECQPRINIDLNLKELIQQQTILFEQIKHQTEANHRSALKLQNDSVIHEALDRLDVQLEGIINMLRPATNNSSSTVIATTIKNHVSSLFDDAMETVKQSVTESLKNTLTEIMLEVNQIGSKTQELASDYEGHISQMHRVEPISDILDELKALASAITTLEAKLITPPPPKVILQT